MASRSWDARALVQVAGSYLSRADDRVLVDFYHSQPTSPAPSPNTILVRANRAGEAHVVAFLVSRRDSTLVTVVPR